MLRDRAANTIKTKRCQTRSLPRSMRQGYQRLSPIATVNLQFPYGPSARLNTWGVPDAISEVRQQKMSAHVEYAVGQRRMFVVYLYRDPIRRYY